jgi:23S rRNA pseudouridine955/2504/2580 synthase
MLTILFEDEDMIVVNKPAGLAVHGGSGVNVGVIEALRKVRDDLPYLELVHRLDRDTSGCLLLAKKRSALRAIHALLEARDVKKTYWAMLSHAWVGKEALTVNAPLDKNILKSGERMVAVDEAGKASSTAFKLIENFSAACWVEASPKTGRTHQIRVHSAYIGHPILGDEKYGYDGPKKSHLYLHARAIQFNLNGIDHRFEAEPEPYFLDEIQKLKKQ